MDTSRINTDIKISGMEGDSYQLDLDGLSSESGIDTGSDQTDGDSPLPDINAR